MSYKIIIDSCGELTEKMKEDGHFASAALTLYVDEHTIVDDETFRQSEFLRLVAESPNCPKSACPSPESFRDKFDCGAEHVYAVTLSSELSGSYNSAELGKNLFLEEHPEKKAYVFNSRSASVGETLIGLKIQECEEAGMSFEEVVEHVEAYIAKQKTWFVLETLDTLRKNGRLSHMNSIVEYVGHDQERILAISHCNCPQRAEMMKEELSKRLHLKDIIVVDTAGISSMYANDGGIIAVV